MCVKAYSYQLTAYRESACGASVDGRRVNGRGLLAASD